MINWNENVKLIITDVDDTVAEVFSETSADMICELEKLLFEGKMIFFISGQSFNNIFDRVIKFIDITLRKGIFVGHCNGAEVIGFDKSGKVLPTPLFSVSHANTSNINSNFRDIINQIIKEFDLEPINPMDIEAFKLTTKGMPKCIMVDDRKLQISFDFINGCKLCDFLYSGELSNKELEANDIRYLIMKRSKELFKEANIPIEAKLGGTIAIDFCFSGVTKGLAIRKLISINKDKASICLPWITLSFALEDIEVWGDNFSLPNRGADLYMSLVLPKTTRSISFRDIEQREIIRNFNIVAWDGKERLNKGLLEYLKSRY
ncbi:MAG: hypothetical protein BWY74_03743 [Firmicutes bacterium ADurb.Bin419]|nr:MAG: hypothetical protein BWY74_03743 [Firmicutes bacterium ADurb.Bin419]